MARLELSNTYLRSVVGCCGQWRVECRIKLTPCPFSTFVPAYQTKKPEYPWSDWHYS